VQKSEPRGSGFSDKIIWPYRFAWKLLPSVSVNMKPQKQPTCQRIVSLAPAITEILFALKLEDRLVGVTDSCDFPPGVRNFPNVSVWFEPDNDKIFSLKPDLILGLETAHRRLKAEMASQGIQLILVNPTTVDAALEDMLRFGEMLDASEAARICVKKLRARLKNLDRRVAKLAAKERLTVCRVLDLEDDMLMVAGPLSFQYDVIRHAGGLNVTEQFKDAYPKISWSRFQELDPQMIFFCGYDRQFITRLKADSKWQSLKAIRTGRLYQYDCGLTCRTGPRIVDMAELLFDTLYGS